MPDKIIVVAIGGNAISGKGTFDSQYSEIKNVVKDFAILVKKGYKIVITHGNGPQVGDALLRNEYAKDLVPALPLHACVAETQGLLGVMFEAALIDTIGKDAKIVSLVTTVKVSAKDPAFKNPTKPIGSLLSKKEAYKIKKIEPNSSFLQLKSGKYQRVVASPEPISISEIDAIKKLVANNFIVIAGGGGGIPITRGKKTNFIEAVVDKDLTSEILASAINASMFVNLTNVPGVYENFGGKNQKILKKISVNKIKDLFDSGRFGQGSIEPKIKAAIRFVENTGNKAVIASIKKAKDAAFLKTGTIIYK